MEWLTKKSKRLILEMSVGVVLYNLVLGLLAGFFLPKVSYPVIPVWLGLFVGGAGAVVMLVHMAVMTERVLDSQNENYANKTTVLQGLIRKLVFVAVILCCWRWFHMDMLAAVIGAMGMKAGAYLQPLVHRIFGHDDGPPPSEAKEEGETGSEME